MAMKKKNIKIANNLLIPQLVASLYEKIRETASIQGAGRPNLSPIFYIPLGGTFAGDKNSVKKAMRKVCRKLARLHSNCAVSHFVRCEVTISKGRSTLLKLYPEFAENKDYFTGIVIQFSNPTYAINLVHIGDSTEKVSVEKCFVENYPYHRFESKVEDEIETLLLAVEDVATFTCEKKALPGPRKTRKKRYIPTQLADDGMDEDA